MKKVLFIDRDGVIMEEPKDEQIDQIEKINFTKGVFTSLSNIAKKLDYRLIMVTNQDGLGTDAFPEDDFWPIQELMVRTLESEGVIFDEIIIDHHFAKDNSKYRKPETGRLQRYLKNDYDMQNSFVIGDRWSDMQLAVNLGCKGIWIHPRETEKPGNWREGVVCKADDWASVEKYLFSIDRKANIQRKTSETNIEVSINLDGDGYSEIQTGLPFFDHMLDQISRHGSIDLLINASGDLEVDEHHTVEDVAIALGEVVHLALGKKAGIQRYGFALPMDDCAATVLLDFGGRSWLNWKAGFQKEQIGDVSTQMFFHFFKSFSEHAKCNLDVKAEGINEHHKIEAIFKAFSRALKMAVRREDNDFRIPSTKGTL